MKYYKIIVLSLFSFYIAINSSAQQGTIQTSISTDVCVYGATGAGIAAATAVARDGYSVVVVCPWHRIGGVLGSGFRLSQDVPYSDHLGGLTKEFYDRDLKYPKLRYPQGATKYNIESLDLMMNPYKERIKIIKNYRLSSAHKSNDRIVEAVFEYAPRGKDGVPVPVRSSENLIRIKAKIYIDASYEGDLMAYSGVSYRVGKESRNEYGESLAGIRLGKTFPGVSPYAVPGNSKSGLLSCIDSEPLGKEGAASKFFNGYNFKLAFEEHPSKDHPGILITPPKEKDTDVYKLLTRYTKAGYPLSWPNENFERDQLMTGAIPGMQLGYPDGNWATRAKIWAEYIKYIRELNDFSGKQTRLLSGINDETGGWPLLYMRGGRRMIGEYIMTQKDIQLQTDPPTPIGMGYYAIDIYPNRLVVLKNGTLASEGNVFIVASPGPYQIPYGAIIPKKKECKNLLVPVCMSASHVAYASIRMEATYMVMGESAGIAAAIAIKENKAVQDINLDSLTYMLEKYGQKLKWNGKGYRVWRYNINGQPVKEETRWETNPEEYAKHPVDSLWK